jgi:hypothetical protein
MTEQEGNQIMFPGEHGKFLRFWFFVFNWSSTFYMLTTNTFHHYLLVVAIIVSRKLVSMGKKSCLFMCHEE